MKLGLHVSIAGKLTQAYVEGVASNSESLQIFSTSPRMWRSRKFTNEEIEEFKGKRGNFGPIAVHASYLINLGSKDEKVRIKSRQAFKEEVERSKALGADYVILHPGGGADEAVTFIGEALSEVLDYANGLKILLENVAGEGNKIGKNFTELANIIAATKDGKRLGVCFDTCHAFAAGYDLREKETWHSLKREIEETVGLESIRFLHLNDCKGDLGSRLDRHANWGEGYLGQATITPLSQDEFFRQIPGVLETPGDLNARTLDLSRCREWLGLEG